MTPTRWGCRGVWVALAWAVPAAANANLTHAQAGVTPAPVATTTGAIATSPAAPVRVTVEGPVRVTSGSVAPSLPNPLLTALLSAAAALAGSFVGFLSARASSRATIVQKTNELEIERLDARMSEFVGPFIQLSEENRLLALELKRAQGKADFRTLTALLTPGWKAGLPKGDAKLLEAVVRNGAELRRLLMDKGSAMVSPSLTPVFSRASTHFRLLELAYEGSLEEDPTRYAAYVYPRELDGIMEAERQRLEQRRELLRSSPYKPHARMADLELPAVAAGPPSPPPQP